VYVVNLEVSTAPPRNWVDDSNMHAASYFLHDIVITNIEWCMAYKGRVGRMSYIAQKSRNSIAVVWVMRMGGGI